MMIRLPWDSTDAVAHRLSSLKSLRVLPLEASRDAAISAQNPAAAARSLGAGFVLEGELRRSGQTLDVDVALVTPDGERRSAGRYSGELGQIFDLQGRIAQGVIAALTQASGIPDQAAPKPPPTSNQQAFAECAQARLFLERPDIPQTRRPRHSAVPERDCEGPPVRSRARGSRPGLLVAGPQTNDTAWTTKATTPILDALRLDRDQPEVAFARRDVHGLGRPTTRGGTAAGDRGAAAE